MGSNINSSTIFEKDLEKHKSKCNARPPAETPDYLSPDLHIVGSTDIADLPTRLSEQPNSTVEAFLLQLRNEGSVLIPEFPTEIFDHPTLCKQKERKTDIKHADQQVTKILYMI